MKRVFKLFLLLFMLFSIPTAALSTQIATITVDGDPSEWASLNPSYIDERDDSACGADMDMRAIYTAMDEQYVYVMVETYGQSIDNTVGLILNFHYGYTNLHTNIMPSTSPPYDNTILNAWIGGDIKVIRDYNIAWGDVMEARISRSDLGELTYFEPTGVTLFKAELSDTGALSDSFTTCDATLTNVFKGAGVFSQVAAYDQSDFPDRDSSVVMGAYATFASNPSDDIDPITLTVNEGDQYSLPYQPSWGIFLGWATATPGPEWKTTYRFESGDDFWVLDLANATFRELTVPVVNISGRTISWNSVENATHYEVWLYGLDSDGYPDNGYPDKATAPLGKSGLLENTLSYVLPDTIPDGQYAIRVNAREYYTNELTDWEWFNRSSFYKKISIGYSQSASEMADALIDTIEGLNLPKSIENSYMANLKKVKDFIENGQSNAAINQLTAFIKKVEKDISKGDISEDEGIVLIKMANQLIAALS